MTGLTSCNWKMRGAIGAMMALGLSTVAFANNLTITIDGTPVTDNEPGVDLNPAVGQITYSSVTSPGFTFNFQLGSTNEPGTSTLANLGLTSNVQRNATAGSLSTTIVVTDTGYTAPTQGPYTLTSSFGAKLTSGASAASESMTSSVTGPSYSTSTPTQSYSVGSGAVASSFSSTNSVGFAALGAPFSLTESATITLGPSASAQLTGTTALTPEPATLGLAAMAGLGLLARRRR